ncbi:conserved protein, unknown function [Hepatocystis sp. ex Piliocolobus tephrosceles]|nr:conserved protein, unknown function [Hepatocystis sp. ex Piliocolobus tephrosceles]
MWNIFSNEYLSLDADKNKEEKGGKKIRKRKGYDKLKSNHMMMMKTTPTMFSNSFNKYDYKIKEMRRRFRRKYRIVRTQLIKITKVVNKLPDVHLEEGGLENAKKAKMLVSEKQEVANEKQDVTSEKQDVTSEKQDVTSEKQDVTSEKQDVTSEKQDVTSEKQNVVSEKQNVVSEKQDVVSEKQDVVSEKQEVVSVKQDVTGEKQEVGEEEKEKLDEAEKEKLGDEKKDKLGDEKKEKLGDEKKEKLGDEKKEKLGDKKKDADSNKKKLEKNTIKEKKTIMIDIELIDRLHKLVEKFDIEKLGSKKNKIKKKNTYKDNEDVFKHKLTKRISGSNRSFYFPLRKYFNKTDPLIMKNKKLKRKLLHSSSSNLKNLNKYTHYENAGLLHRNTLKNNFYDNYSNSHNKKQIKSQFYNDSNNLLVTDFYMYSTLNASFNRFNSMKKHNNFGIVHQNNLNNTWDSDNVITNSNTAYGHNYNKNNDYYNTNYKYSSGNYNNYTNNYMRSNYSYDNNIYNDNFKKGLYNINNWKSKKKKIWNNYNFDKNIKSNNFQNTQYTLNYNNNNSSMILNNYMSSQYTGGECGDFIYELQTPKKMLTLEKRLMKNMYNKKKVKKFVKDEKIRDLLRTAENENELIKAINFAKHAGLYFEAALGDKKLNRLKVVA